MSGIYVALDLEATGMDPERDEIIEIAAIKFRNDRVLDRWESLVRPRGPIPFNITSLTGIGAKDVRRAPIFPVVAPRLRDFVRNHPIVGQSPEFDIQMLAGAGLRLQNPLYDTFQLATILIPDLPAYNLATIAARLGVSVPHQHRAMADVETTMAVFLGLQDILLSHDAETLARLAELARVAGSPLARLFAEARREVASLDGMGHGTIAAQLMAKTGMTRGGPEVLFLFQRERPPRLEPTGSDAPIDVEALRAWTEPGGALAQTFPGYEPRPQQVAMLAAVAEGFNQGGTYLIEAGTGTGKSLAYLLPAILHAVNRGEPVVISTNTIALQDQLFRKDLPDLRRALKEMARTQPELERVASFEAALLKGRSNYLCLRRWFLAQREPSVSPERATLYAKILTWLQQTETGDRAELHLSPEEQVYWLALAEEEGSCVPGRCIFHRRNQCFLYRARHKAESAHVIVVNHALLLSDMLAANNVLPPYRHLIIDEAHNLEDEATTQLGFSISRHRILDFVSRCVARDDDGALGGALGGLWSVVANARVPLARDIAASLQPQLDGLVRTAREASEEIERFFHALGDFVERYQAGQSEHDRRLRLTDAVRHDPGWSTIEISWDQVAGRLREIVGVLVWAAGQWEGISEEEIPERDEVATELEVLIRTGHELIERVLGAIANPSPDMIYWLTRNVATGDVAISAAPLHVGDVLREHLFDRCRTTILTSATLTTDGSFDYVRQRLGIDEAHELQVPSPFDYPATTLLYLADDVPEPGQPGHQRHVQEALIDLCKATRGRAMVLFTSHSALQTTYRAIKRPLEAEGILVLAQRMDGSPRQLIDRLKSHPETVLLGTNSFWEGVDIVGDALSLLVITRLPFSVPSDPVFAARSELFEDPFNSYAIPQAVLRFKQGFGRLIRSSTDRGVCVVLDRRTVSRRYGSSFVRSLPDCTVVVGPTSELPARASEWLQARPASASV
ncbi:helicase C-terminal domain-containing protein [Sphaerobacter thermophilus]|uniref:3'-5' exonuclease DinG n=1 Tax=Sphaerobacter thermophilus (strain ATCC 49802 / DSM 20745 / KCCM 41009 / NCIMB 13125 / S 6022) TaxID=479434 RepID=D1C2H0_SPHTD|nr:helicase C-terminal domain-containing protein [Sphaerobacter thermophilus]ACZ38437.1 Exonuclease RNase T and DNA polymerase III [Sphaerobacter thermophilus DSM 20745]PZN68235.1 MAG: exonuclease [Sphaerobacter thermophilus]